MDRRQTKKQLEKKIKEICRQLNNQPIEVFIEAFDRLNIFKEYEQAHGDWKTWQTQMILQKLKEDHVPRRKRGDTTHKRRALRFIIAVKGLWQGARKNIWVITSSAQLEDIRRFQEQKLRLIEDQVNLFDDWQDEVENRTGNSQERLGSRLQSILSEMRRRLGLNGGDSGPALPPPEPTEDH